MTRSRRAKHSDAPLSEAVAELLRERGLSISALARALGLSQPFLSRALRGVDQKRATPQLIQAIAEALEVEPRYFIDYRRFQIGERLAADSTLTNAVYDFVERQLSR